MASVAQRSLGLLVCQLVLAGVFILAAFPKIQDPVSFASSIEGYRILRGAPVNWAALLLPWLELIVGVGILIPWLRKASSMIITLLLSTFIALHTISWARGLDITCGCFGESDQGAEYHWLILRNLVFLAAVIPILIIAFRRPKSP